MKYATLGSWSYYTTRTETKTTSAIDCQAPQQWMGHFCLPKVFVHVQITTKNKLMQHFNIFHWMLLVCDLQNSHIRMLLLWDLSFPYQDVETWEIGRPKTFSLQHLHLESIFLSVASAPLLHSHDKELISSVYLQPAHILTCHITLSNTLSARTYILWSNSA